MTPRDLFNSVFKDDPLTLARAPGRINLIGEHTDYNGGLVLPMTLPLFTEVAIGPSTSGKDEIYSDRFAERQCVSVGAKSNRNWFDYASGALQTARRLEWLSGPTRVAVHSILPDGAGLSSSAALIIAILKAAAKLSSATPSVIDLARYAQEVEHNHIGVPCGIMDQMIIAADPPYKAMQLDTQTLQYELVSIPSDWRIAVIHSGVSRKLNEGRYTVRRRECLDAATQLGAEWLCLLTDQQKSQISKLDLRLRARARHVYSDHERVKQAAAALRNRDIEALGAILTKGHQSLRDDFEVSTPEIDQLVEISLNSGAKGARLSGGGFGGCVVSVMPEKNFHEWRARVLTQFPLGSWVC